MSHPACQLLSTSVVVGPEHHGVVRHAIAVARLTGSPRRSGCPIRDEPASDADDSDRPPRTTPIACSAPPAIERPARASSSSTPGVPGAS